MDDHVFRFLKTWTSMFFKNMDDRMLFKIEHRMFDSIVVLVWASLQVFVCYKITWGLHGDFGILGYGIMLWKLFFRKQKIIEKKFASLDIMQNKRYLGFLSGDSTGQDFEPAKWLPFLFFYIFITYQFFMPTMSQNENGCYL